MDSNLSAAKDAVSPIPLREAVWTWWRIALLSFGGPAGQIAVMHRILVDEKKWISEQRFLHALNYCMLLPGPEAQQLATYIGWLLHRSRGGLIAGLLFILPGFVSILGLSILYAHFQQTTIVQAIFFGLKPAVLAIVLQAVLRISKRVLKNRTMIALACSSFVAIHFFNVPFPVLIVIAGTVGFIGGRLAPERFIVIKGHKTAKATDVESLVTERLLYSVKPTMKRSITILTIFLTLWFVPIFVLTFFLGNASVFVQEGYFFSKAAVVTFGGAYSVLGYVAQQAVNRYGWLRPGEMLDGLGMAETTPGPLILVVQFVGFLGAYRDPGPFTPLVAGVIGSMVTTWVTFVPCFLWIFLGAPYIERLRENQLLSAALSAITASVVGVILNLSIWFSLHTLFRDVQTITFGPLRILAPEMGTINLTSLAIALVALSLTFYLKKGVVMSLTVSAAMGVCLYVLGYA